MNYVLIKPVSVADGEGVRVSLFVAGCRRRCPGCFNPETWDFEAGQKFGHDEYARLIGLLRPDYIKGLSVLGGEPFEPENRADVCAIVRAVKAEYPDKPIWAYTGFKYEELLELSKSEGRPLIRNILDAVDVLVDGSFIEAERDPSLAFRGSRNQRIIRLNEVRKFGDKDAKEDNNI